MLLEKLVQRLFLPLGRTTVVVPFPGSSPPSETSVSFPDTPHRLHLPQGGLAAALEREFSQGDRVPFTAPSRELHVANCDLGTVEQVNSNGGFRIRMDSGREVRFNIASIRTWTTDTQ
jgi:hypothetical protein